MRKNIIRRPSANETRKNILKSAQKLFVKKGLAGVSISEIAKAAKINQSLIYHHFKNKNALWQQVKLNLCTNHATLHPLKSLKELADKDLMTFLDNVIRQRFYLYWENPDAIRIINWQRLEPNYGELHTSCYSSPDEWCQMIETLQQRGEIRQDLAPEWVMILITNATAGLFIDYDAFFSQKKNPISEKYIPMIISSLYRALH